MIRTPSAEEQLQFLTKLQRLFAEGDFTATYKFALLIALAELAVERGFDNREPLMLQHAWPADQCVPLYWHTAPPCHGPARPAIVPSQHT